MENKLFREKSIKRISSPEQLNDYLHVTNPGIWALLICVIVLLAGIFTWASKASIESFVTGSGRVESGVLKVTLDQVPSGVQIETGMMINVGGKQTSVSFVGKDENGNLMAGGMRDALKEDGALGILTGALKSSAAGIGAAIFFSLIAAFVGKSKDKN